MKKLEIGIVGANWAARGHLPGWRMLTDRVETLAVCTTRTETAWAAAEALRLERAHHDFQQMLDNPDIDVVSLGAPPPARYEMTMAALARNKHVFSCVPFAVTTEQADAMTRLQEERTLVGAVDAYFMWTPGLAFLKDMIDDGFLGDLYEVSVDFSMAQFIDMRADYPYRWTAHAANGTGILPNSCSHIFHLLIHLFGPIEEIIGATRISNKCWTFEDGTSQVPEVADTAVVIARLAQGSLVNIHAGRAVPSATGFRLSAYGSILTWEK